MKNYYDRTRPPLTFRDWLIAFGIAVVSTVILFTLIGWRG